MSCKFVDFCFFTDSFFVLELSFPLSLSSEALDFVSDAFGLTLGETVLGDV